MDDVLIIGAGAIGRGYLPWVFPEGKYNLTFVDQNYNVISTMRKQKYFTSYMSQKGKGLVKRRFPISAAFTTDDFNLGQVPNPITCYLAVGPRNVANAAHLIKGARCPVVLLENDDKVVDLVKAVLGTENVYFAIPDVIASSTARDDHLADDPLAIHTEDGALFVDERARRVEGTITYCSPSELKNQWMAKFYLHNTPHCVAAYFGALHGLRFLHEVMVLPKARKIVEGCMNEMLKALKLTWNISHDFLDWYADKELSRFSNTELYDPISRVAREPFRKLELDGRLVGAALMCLKLGYVPTNLLLGITAALLFENPNDSDQHIIFARKYLPPSIIFSYLLKLRCGEALESILSSNFETLIAMLDDMRK